LFGNEDVDLRQLPPAVPVITKTLPPSPPPPPIISQPLPVPTSSSSSQDSLANTTLSPKQPSPEREREEAEHHIDESKTVNEEEGKENSGIGLKSRSWAKYKELKPDTYKSPLRPLGHFSHDLGLPKSHSSSPGSNSPLRERSMMYGSPRDRGMSHFHRSTGRFDKLGRPLLYHRLPGILELRLNVYMLTYLN